MRNSKYRLPKKMNLVKKSVDIKMQNEIDTIGTAVFDVFKLCKKIENKMSVIDETQKKMLNINIMDNFKFSKEINDRLNNFCEHIKYFEFRINKYEKRVKFLSKMLFTKEWKKNENISTQ